jgi:hypothetical protein
MKAVLITVVTLMVLGTIIIALKPSDAICTSKGKEWVNDHIAAGSPDYFNPDSLYADTTGKSTQLMIVKNKVFWKEIDYSWNGQVKVMGYGYLGKTHLSKFN